MKYIVVVFKDLKPANLEQPIICYSEFDDRGREQRKICVFQEGPPGYAAATKAKRGIMLNFEPMPSLSELSTNPKINKAVEITNELFEKCWQYAVSDPVVPRLEWQDILQSILQVLASLG